MFLEYGRDVALGILEGLLALVVRGNLGGVGVRDFNVIAEDFVEADFKAGDAGLGDFLGLKLGDPALAVAGDGVQAIQLGVAARPDQAAFARTEWRGLREGARPSPAPGGGKIPPPLPTPHGGRHAGPPREPWCPPPPHRPP